MNALIGLLLGAVLSALSGAAASAPALDVQVVGSGRPVLMLHGLASHRDVWNETCAALQPQAKCHLVQLPGFAGALPQPTERYLQAQQAALQAYLQGAGLKDLDVMGHSLGGNLALMLAAAEPQRVRRLVLVDTLPFLAGIRNPAATPEQAQQMAAGLKAQMAQGAQQTPAQQAAQHQAMARGMTRSPDRQQTLARWGMASNGATVVQAMTELWAGDFRPLLPQIQQPVLVLGAWAAYERMGSTLESTRALFEHQYAVLKDKRVAMSAEGFHFLMWDDPDWLVAQVRVFLQP